MEPLCGALTIWNGISMETIDFEKICQSTYPYLLQNWHSFTSEEKEAIISMIADGYAFPTNLDKDSPINGRNSPQTMQELVKICLDDGVEVQRFFQELNVFSNRRK